MKLKIGDVLPDFTFDTPFEKGKSLYAAAEGKPVFLLFLRYYGCTVCQLDIRELKNDYARFTQKGAKVLVVLQSKPELIAEKYDKLVDLVIDSGYGDNVASTIVDLTSGEPEIIRQGKGKI